MQTTIVLTAVLTCILILAAPGRAHELVLTTRRRDRGPDGVFLVKREEVVWNAKATAAIVCDMWDKHWCRGATRRVAELAPRMNEMLRRARKRGVFIVHAPSGCMEFYKDHPARKRAIRAPRAPGTPEFLAKWAAKLDSEKNVPWPLDQSDGGCDCRPKCSPGSPWRKQVDAIQIKDEDAITDSGAETWGLLAARGIDNVILMGVHTNMCVIGRPFGLRNLKRAGKTVVLVRDLTDTMYDPRRRPFVSHFRGTDLIVEYIEKHVCPTVISSAITGPSRASGSFSTSNDEEPFRFPGDRRPRIVFAIAEREYRTWETLPRFAGEVLGDRYDLSVTVVYGEPEKNRNVIPGFEDELSRADLVFLSVRRRALPAGDLAALRRHLDAGKPLCAVRTSSHAFATRASGTPERRPAGHEEWPTFDREVLGCHYRGHHGAGPGTTVTVAEGAKDHPILAGVRAPFTSKGSLYRSSPLARSATLLLVGTVPGKEPEPVAWTNTYRKARIFYTSLGHPDDFLVGSTTSLRAKGASAGGALSGRRGKGGDPPVVRLLTNAVFWALARDK